MGVPADVKADELRVALTPAGVRELVERGHEVVVQVGAGEGSAIADGDYAEQGARIAPDAETVFARADIVVKVAQVAIGMGADVRVLDRDLNRLRELDVILADAGRRCSRPRSPSSGAAGRRHRNRGGADTRRARADSGDAHAPEGDEANAVVVDVSIDQGGCFETSRPTTDSNPTYEVEGVTHYCVANMPGAVPITSTLALTNATIPYVIRLADRGVAQALRSDPGSWRASMSPPDV